MNFQKKFIIFTGNKNKMIAIFIAIIWFIASAYRLTKYGKFDILNGTVIDFLGFSIGMSVIIGILLMYISKIVCS